jgi:hypothetical protein
VKTTRQPVRGPSRLTFWIVTGCMVWCVAGCVSQDVADKANERLNYGMSTAEVNLARSVAFDRARMEGAKVTAKAAVSAAHTSGSSSTPPKPCAPGSRLLHITLAGQFPHAAQSGPKDVSGQELTVDAITGRVCDAHYLTGPIALNPEAVPLFTNY